MSTAILLLVTAGLTWVSVGAAVGHVERSGYSLLRYQILNCLVCVAFGAVGWLLLPESFLPAKGCPRLTWVLVIAATLLCGVFNYSMVVMMGRAMKRGPNSIVWAIVQSGLIYPFLMGWLVFGVHAGPRRLCGIALIIASIFLYAARKGPGGSRHRAAADADRAPLREWLPAALVGMLFCGINQCGANLPSYLEGGTDFSATFRASSIFFGQLAAALAHMAIKRVNGQSNPPPVPGEMRGLAMWCLGIGGMSFLTTKFLAIPGLDRLRELGVGSMGYPVMVASCIIGFFPYGLFILRERLNPLQALGAVLGIAGILLGCL